MHKHSFYKPLMKDYVRKVSSEGVIPLAAISKIEPFAFQPSAKSIDTEIQLPGTVL